MMRTGPGPAAAAGDSTWRLLPSAEHPDHTVCMLSTIPWYLWGGKTVKVYISAKFSQKKTSLYLSTHRPTCSGYSQKLTKGFAKRNGDKKLLIRSEFSKKKFKGYVSTD